MTQFLYELFYIFILFLFHSQYLTFLTCTISIDQLTLDVIRDVLSALWDARSKWYNIGLQLGIDPVALDAIRMEDRDDPSNCLRSAIRIYLTNPSHNKSWSAIVCALNSPPVSFHLLTNELESKFLSVGDVATQKSDAETATPGT